MQHCLKEYQNISCARLSGKRWFTVNCVVRRIIAAMAIAMKPL